MEYGFEIKTSKKAKRVRITIYPGPRVVVTKPIRVSGADAERFVHAKQNWIARKVAVMQARKKLPLGDGQASKNEALVFVQERIKYFNQHYNFTVGRVSVKNHKSLWGSCSRRGNLNFNQRISLLPVHQADYIIVHELCHLKEFNHSRNFWTLVAETAPKYQTIRREMKDYSFS